VADRKKRRRSRNGFVDIANGLLTLVIIGLVIAGGLVIWGAQQFYSDGPVAEDTTFLVEKGNGLGTIGSRLAAQKLINNGLIFRAGVWLTKNDASVLPGEYVIPAHSSMADILKVITEEKPVEYFINVPPGESSYQVAQRVNAAAKLSGDPVSVPAEGSILPVRHDYFPLDNRDDVLKSMQDAMVAVVDKAWAACRPDVCGPDQPIKTKA
jgi:UPF0755 protein